MSLSTLKIIYNSLFHSRMSYGIIFLGNSSHSSVVFQMQGRVIRIIIGCGYRESCRKLFKELKILPPYQSIYSLYCCLLLIIGIILFQIVYIITIIPDKK